MSWWTNLIGSKRQPDPTETQQSASGNFADSDKPNATAESRATDKNGRRASPLSGLGGSPTHRPSGTLEHWEAQGLGRRQGQQFALDIQNIPAIGQFARVLPAWSLANDCEVRLTIEARPQWEGGAAVELTFNRKDLPVAMGQDLLTRLEAAGALMALTQTIEHMKSVGADSAHIDPLVGEANRLAQSLRDEA
jgi:hypothetical protein